MTLLTTTTPAAEGQPSAPPTSTGTPSSGAPEAKPGEQPAAGKDSPAGAEPTAEPTEKAKGDNGGETTENKEAKPADKFRGAPTAYSFKAPEGHEVGADAQTALSDVARELDLSNDAAQKIIDKMAPALQSQQQRNLSSIVNGWAEDTKKHFGDKLTEEISYGQRALSFASPEMRQLLDSGLGNNRHFIAWAAALGRKLSPDTKSVPGDRPPAPPTKSAVERLAETYAAPSAAS